MTEVTEPSRRHSDALLSLSQLETVFRGDLDSALRAVTERAVEALDVERVGVWLFDEARERLVASDVFRRSEGRHEAGESVLAAEFPEYFRALGSSREIVVSDVETDLRTLVLWEAYFRPHGIRSLIHSPIRLEGTVVGVLGHEHCGPRREWKDTEVQFASSVADFTALALEASDRRKVEQKLRETSSFLKGLIASSPGTIFQLRPSDLKPTYVSPNFPEITGYEISEFLGDRDFWIERVHPDDRDGVLELLGGAMREGRRQVDTEFRFLHADGAFHWFIGIAAFDYEEKDGQPLGITGYTIDITQRKEAEHALRQSEQRYRALFEHSRDAVYLSRRDGQILELNDAALEMLGVRREDIPGLNAADLYVEQEDRIGFQEAIAAQGTVKDFEIRLRKRDGTVMNCLLTSTARRDDLGRIVGYQGIIRDVTAKVNFEHELEHRALHDWLTGLPNRALFFDRLEHALARIRREGGALAVLFLDLDGFKSINDRWGHSAGDDLLVKAARRIAGSLREEDTVARFGGDEFTVLLERVESVEDATEAAARTLSALRESCRVDGVEIRPSASVGIALYGLGDPGAVPTGGLADELVRRGDAAMYAAKDAGGGRYRVFEPDRDCGAAGPEEPTPGEQA